MYTFILILICLRIFNAHNYYDDKAHSINFTFYCVDKIFNQYGGYDFNFQLNEPFNHNFLLDNSTFVETTPINENIFFNKTNNTNVLNNEEKKIDFLHFSILLARLGLKSGYTLLHNDSIKEIYIKNRQARYSRKIRHVENGEEHTLSTEKDCLSPREILEQFNMPLDEGISKHDFLAHICPVLIYQLDKDECRRFPPAVSSHPFSINADERGFFSGKISMTAFKKLKMIKLSIAWIYALVSVLLISIVGFLLVLVFCRFLVPNKKRAKKCPRPTTTPGGRYFSVYTSPESAEDAAFSSDGVSGHRVEPIRPPVNDNSNNNTNKDCMFYAPKSVEDQLLNNKTARTNKKSKRRDNKALSQFCVALAVGSLSGDALLHLLPHAIFEANLTDHVHNDKIMIWKGFLTLSVIILFFLFEKMTRLFSVWRDTRASTTAMINHFAPPQTSLPPLEKQPVSNSTPEDLVVTTYQLKDETPPLITDTKSPTSNLVTFVALKPGDNSQVDNQPRGLNNVLPNLYNHLLKSPRETILIDKSSKRRNLFRSLSSNALTCIFGDAVHNMFDGLAIGAAYTGSVTAGISTTIAILCHELPHELGDFAYLTKIGVPPKISLFFNCVSSICALLGCLIGLLISSFNSSTDSEGHNRPDDWIFCAISGMFLYVSLSNMIPDLRMANDVPNPDGTRSCKTSVFNFPLPDQWDLDDPAEPNKQHSSRLERLTGPLRNNNNSNNNTRKKKLKKNPYEINFWEQFKYFGLQIAGIFTGVSIMLVIALYEEDIQKLIA